MSELDLEATEARCEAATPGPWVVRNVTSTLGVSAPNSAQRSKHIVSCGGICYPCGTGQYNAAFIASARTDIPALVAEIRRLRAELEQARLTTLEACAALCDERARLHNSTLPRVSEHDEVRYHEARNIAEAIRAMGAKGESR